MDLKWSCYSPCLKYEWKYVMRINSPFVYFDHLLNSSSRKILAELREVQ